MAARPLSDLAASQVNPAAVTPMLAEQAATCPVTGLYNRALMHDIAEARLSEARRHGYQASVVLAEIDGFKDIADSYGRSASENVLRGMAELLRMCLRREDVVARAAPDGFVILMMHCDAENAFAKADALRDALAQLEPDGVPVTASFGVASASVRRSVDFDLLYRWADQALATARQTGANRTVLAAGSDAETPATVN